MCRTEIWTQGECLSMLYPNRVLERPVTWPKFYRPKMDKTLTILIITDIDEKWFLIFEHNINRLSFGYVRLLQLEYYFSFSFLFFTSFFFPYYLLLTAKRTVFNAWAIEDIREE